MNILIASIIVLFVLLGNIPVFAQDNSTNYAEYVPKHFLFLLDCSKKMNKRWNYSETNKQYNDIKQWLPQYIETLPPEIPIGMRVYGHDDGMITFNKCDNSDIIAYVGFEKNKKIIDNLEDFGSSKEIPLGVSLNKAIRYDFNNISGHKEIILITNNSGNCKGKACQLVLALLKGRKDIKINVIAVNVKSKRTEKKLACLSNATFGKFYSVSNMEQFKKAVDDIVMKDFSKTNYYKPAYNSSY